eukprot:6962581-Lingulodinium_polyedra.AAC.1
MACLRAVADTADGEWPLALLILGLVPVAARALGHHACPLVAAQVAHAARVNDDGRTPVRKPCVDQ